MESPYWVVIGLFTESVASAHFTVRLTGDQPMVKAELRLSVLIRQRQTVWIDGRQTI